MKTVKFALIAAFIACTMVSLANTDGFKSKPKPIKVVNLTLEKAITIPGLVLAMYDQLSKEDVLANPQLNYVGEVTYNGVLFRISGSREQWIKFFRMKGELPPTKNPIVIETN